MSSKHTLKDKYNLFINEYINNGFNATQAYAKVYKVPVNHSCEVMASRLLRNVKVLKLYCQALAKMELDITEEFILQEVINILKQPKTENKDKLRSLELLSRIKGYMKPDSQTKVSIYQSLEDKKQALHRANLSQAIDDE